MSHHLAPASPSNCTCTTSLGQHISFVRLTGELDGASAPLVHGALLAATSRPVLLVLADLRGVDALDVRAAQALVEAHATSARDERRLVVLSPESADGFGWALLHRHQALEVMGG